MLQVDFYNLSAQSIDEYLFFVCRLTNKAWKQKTTTYIHCMDEEQRHQLNNLLWGFKSDSFIPHDLIEENQNSPVVLGLEGLDYSQLKHNLLVNLSFTFPKHYQQFTRIAELVIADPKLKENARENYRMYVDKGHKVQYHTINYKKQVYM